MTGLLDWLFERRVARLRVRPASRRAVLRLGARLIECRRVDDADAVLETALAHWPGRPRLLHLYAMSAHGSGRYRVALSRWEALRRADPNAAPAWCGIAANARMLDDLRTAESIISRRADALP